MGWHPGSKAWVSLSISVFVQWYRGIWDLLWFWISVSYWLNRKFAYVSMLSVVNIMTDISVHCLHRTLLDNKSFRWVYSSPLEPCYYSSSSLRITPFPFTFHLKKLQHQEREDKVSVMWVLMFHCFYFRPYILLTCVTILNDVNANWTSWFDERILPIAEVKSF